MNNITYAVSVDVNNPIIPYNVYVASVLDSNVRYLEIMLYQNGDVIALSNTATATASLVTDNVLVNDSVNCTIQDNIITVPLEDLQRHGNLDVQVTVTEGTKVLAIPFPIQVRVTPNIAEDAQIDENSLGSYAEVVQEIVNARGGYTTLQAALAAKANAAPGSIDETNLSFTPVKYVGSNDLDECINSGVLYRVHDGSAYQLVICSLGTYAKTQYMFTQRGTVKSRTMIGENAWSSWSPIGENENIADDAVTIEKLQSNIRTSISNADACALTLSRNFGINVSAESTNENYHMRADGGGEPKVGYEIRRYPVSAGQIISIYCSDSEAGCKWVFKSANSGHWNVNVGNVHPNAGRWIVEVPENATYLFTSTFIGDSTSEIAIIPQSTRGHIRGYILYPCIFVYLSAQKLHVECTATARAVLGNEILNISGWSDIFTPRTNSTDALVMGANAFSLKRVEDLTDDDCVIALVYLPQKTVVPVDKNIYANAIPIDNLYKRSNIPVYINNRRIKRYQIAPNRNSANITDFGYFYKLNNVSSTQPLMYIAQSGKLVPNLNTYSTNNISIANKTILCIGDSVTKRGWYQERLKSHESTLSFIGTQMTYYGQNGNATDGKYYCEGYSGRTAKNVLVDSTILLNDNVTRIANPFYDAGAGKCDFGYYCRTQNVNPDYVVIEFGLNETNSEEYYSAISSFIATIKAYNLNTVVYVVQPFNAIDGGDIGAANSMTAMQREACERCILESRSFTDCVLIPCWYIMVDEYDYPIAEASYGYANLTVEQASDGVHPSENVGFAKLGDQIYNYLGLENDV